MCDARKGVSALLGLKTKGQVDRLTGETSGLDLQNKTIIVLA